MGGPRRSDEAVKLRAWFSDEVVGGWQIGEFISVRGEQAGMCWKGKVPIGW